MKTQNLTIKKKSKERPKQREQKNKQKKTVESKNYDYDEWRSKFENTDLENQAVVPERIRLFKELNTILEKAKDLPAKEKRKFGQQLRLFIHPDQCSDPTTTEERYKFWEPYGLVPALKKFKSDLLKVLAVVPHEIVCGELFKHSESVLKSF